MKGDCKRGGKCKFRHMLPTEYESELLTVTNYRPKEIPRVDVNEGFDKDVFELTFESYEPTEPKRRHCEEFQAINEQVVSSTTVFPEYTRTPLEQENGILKKKIEELNKKVSDLTATNEFLLDQNAQMRIKQAAASAAALSVPTVSIASALPPPPVSVSALAPFSQQLPITVVGVSAAPMEVNPVTPAVAGPANVPNMAAAQTVVCNMAGAPTVVGSMPGGPAVVGSIAGGPTVVGSVAGPPSVVGSIAPPVAAQSAAVGSLNTVPLTIAGVNTMPAVTISQQIAACVPPHSGPPPQPIPLSINSVVSAPPSIPLSHNSVATAPMVSYPVMSKGMRPALPSNLAR